MPTPLRTEGGRPANPPAAVEPGLHRLLDFVAARLERNGLRVTGRVRLERLTPEEVRCLSGLLGSRWRPVLPGASATVSLAMLDDALRGSAAACSLVEAAAAARGAPLVDRRAARGAAADARERVWDALARHPAVERQPRLADWLGSERATGGATRAARSDGEAEPFTLVATALDLLLHLPADPPQTLARFAATRCGGDPHALDRGRPLDTVLRRALAHLDGDAEPGSGAEARRQRYERWALGCDELSSTVLCAALRPAGGHPLAAALRASSHAGQPRVVTLRELREVDVLAAGADVFCCENPDVVAAAADGLGPACAPLVCTAGWPSSACLRILRALVAGGATVHHHGDMDPEGLRIVTRVLTVTGGRLWRMSATDHDRAAADGAPLYGFQPPADLAPDLGAVADSMHAHGRAVREEQVLDGLLADLRAAAR
jgi:uncharacterized protein (TIGR02679 family)